MNDTLVQDELLVAGALASVGINVKSVWDLVNTSVPYPQAIDMLIQLLPVVRDIRVKEGIVRALTVREAKRRASQALIQEYRTAGFASDVHPLKWAIGNALCEVAGPQDVESILELVNESRNATSRQMLCIGLGKLRDSRAIPVLMEALRDAGIQGHAIEGLRRLKAVEARDSIEALLGHPQEWVRKEAERAIKVINNELTRRENRKKD